MEEAIEETTTITISTTTRKKRALPPSAQRDYKRPKNFKCPQCEKCGKGAKRFGDLYERIPHYCESCAMELKKTNPNIYQLQTKFCIFCEEQGIKNKSGKTPEACYGPPLEGRKLLCGKHGKEWNLKHKEDLFENVREHKKSRCQGFNGIPCSDPKATPVFAPLTSFQPSLCLICRLKDREHRYYRLNESQIDTTILCQKCKIEVAECILIDTGTMKATLCGKCVPRTNIVKGKSNPPLNYINVRTRYCELCQSDATYGYVKSHSEKSDQPKGPLRCKPHIEEGMCYVHERKCSGAESCDGRAIYVDTEHPISKYCADHRVDLKDTLDLELTSHHYCSDCKTLSLKKEAYFGFPGESSCYCKSHAKPGMVLNPTRYDPEKQCETCAGPMKKTDEDDAVLFCPSCEGKTHIKKQQEQLRQRLLDAGYAFVYDTGILRIRNALRPDFLFDLGDRSWDIDMENDENQHRCRSDCTPEDEKERMKELRGCNAERKKNAMQKLMCIRINPDKFQAADGTTQNPSFEERWPWIKEALDYWMTHEPDDMLSAVYLFYDGFDMKDKTKVPLQVIDTSTTATTSDDMSL